MPDVDKHIPRSFLEKWQNIADLLAKVIDIPAALIMKTENEHMEVYISSKTANNPYQEGDKEQWHGLYCETVIKTQQELHVSNALKDKNWDKNPDIKLGMIAYLGIPLNFPDNKSFGTICVLDNKENEFGIEDKALLYQFKNVIELDLALIQSFDWNKPGNDIDVIHKLVEQNEEYLAINEELQQANSQLLEEKEKVMESEKHFHLLVENAPDAIFIQTNWKFDYINKRGLELFGAKAPEQLIGTNVMDRFHPDFHDKVKQRIVGLFEKLQIQPLYEQVYLKMDGTPVHVETSAIPYKYHNKNGALVFVRDITERKDAEIKLLHRHRLMDYVIKNDPNGIAVFDKDLHFIYVSERFLSDFNISNNEIIGKHHYTVFPEIPDKWRLVHQRALKGETIRNDDDIFIREDGIVEYSRWECRPWKHYDDSIGGIIIYTEIITDRKHTENQLKVSEEKFRKAFYTIPESVTITRLDNGEYISLNDGFTRMLGYTEEEAIGKTSIDLQVWKSEEERKLFVDLIDHNEFLENYEASFKTKQGDIIDCLVSVSKLSIDNVTHILAITRDVTERKKLEDSTRKAYELIKNLAAQVPGVIYQYRQYPDGSSAFPYSSEGMYDIYEVTPEEVKEDASPVFTRIHPDDFDNIVKGINESARNQTVYQSKYRVILPKQGLRWRQSNAMPELLADGSTLWHGIILDITDEKIQEDLLNEKSEEINTFFDCALDLLCIADVHGNFIRLNNEWENVLGFSLNELEGEQFMDFVHPDDVNSTRQALAQLENQQTIINFTNRYLCKDGSYRWIEWKSTPVGKHIYGAARDITDKIRTNQELLIAKEKAEEANRLKTEFLNNMSHEIRTPMNGIIGFSEMLDNSDIPEEKRKYYTKIVRNSSLQLLRIIDDILEISTLETKQEKLVETEFCLNDLLMDLFSIFTLKSNEQNIPVRVKKGLPDNKSLILTDKTRLNKILSNLLENAFKFTNDGFIEFGYYIEKPNLVFYVKDTGIGISRENHKVIFERFSQEDKEISRKYGGLGLGLSISKENTQLLRGDITLKSEKGKGSTFYVTIPYQPAQLAYSSTVEKNSEGLLKDENYTILVAEDEEVNYLYIEALFEEATDSNYNILHAKNGQEAVDICMENKDIDIILMDIKMPILNGHIATEKIKSKFPDLPIIAQTAYSTESDKQLALAHGFDDFITKPINKEALFGLVNKYVKMKHS